MKKTDESIWIKFQNGDDDALSLIYKEYADKLYSYGLKIINDDQLVKDSIQEVFIQLIDRRKSLIITSTIHIYLYKSLRNKLFEEFRSSNRKQDIIKLISEDEILMEDHTEQLMIDSEERQSIRNELISAMNQLTDRQKEVIFLRYTEGFDYDKIAELLNIDKASACTLLYRSIKSLRKTLNEKTFI
jgi:RNA polymerase sigma factor (sigma-70 family)